jgi:hypothetical protein
MVVTANPAAGAAKGRIIVLLTNFTCTTFFEKAKVAK